MKISLILKNPHSKRGQVTVFIIIAIILLIVAGIYGIYRYINYRNAQAEQQQTDLFNSNVETVKQYMKDCISTKAYDGLKKMGLQGGYIEVTPEIRYYDTVFWQKEGVNYQPSLEETNHFLVSYVNDNLASCVNYTVVQKMGYTIKAGKANTSVTFASQEVMINVKYPIRIEQGNRVTEFNDFSETLELRFRKMWELATRVNNRISEPDFNMSDPLNGIDKKDFELNYERTSDNRLIYTIEDKNSYVFGKNDYVFKFVYQRGESDLVKEMKLQENCEMSPTAFTSTLYSINRNARLTILPGTTFSVPDESCIFTVQQLPPFNITVENITTRVVYNYSYLPPKYGKKKYVLDRPVYQFGPDGTVSSKPMNLELYWNEEDTPRKGTMGILTDHGGYWHPIDSNPDYKNKVISTKIDGFSNYTTVDCGLQNLSLRVAIMPWSNMIPSWDKIEKYIDPTGGMITNLLGGHEVPLPITLSLPELPQVGLSCVDVTPTCDTLVVIFRVDVGERQVPDIDKKQFFMGDEAPLQKVIKGGVPTKNAKGSCRILPNTNEVITDITTFDVSNLGNIFQGEDLQKILSYIAIIVFDFKRELGLDVLNIDTSLAGVDLSATYLQGGHKYQLCAIPAQCSGTVCLTACGAVYP